MEKTLKISKRVFKTKNSITSEDIKKSKLI
jgi:hypothetical protein